MSSPYCQYNLGLYYSGVYTPGIVVISSVTQSNPALVSTVTNHNYVIGQEVQFFVPLQWGMRNLNLLKGYVLTVPTLTTFTVNIDTSQFDLFVTPIPTQYVVIQNAQVAAIGDFNTGTLAPGGILPLPQTIPGAFINTPY